MGYMQAMSLAEIEDLRTALIIHLRSNMYPPLPLDYVEPLIEAIEFCNNKEYRAYVALPKDIVPYPRLAEFHHVDDCFYIDAIDLISACRAEPFMEDEEF